MNRKSLLFSIVLVMSLLLSSPAFADQMRADTGSSLRQKELLEQTLTARITDQILLVVDHNLTLWNKNPNGSWEKQLDVYCGYGRNGLKLWNTRQEGDGTTPIGSFPILHAFGFGANPGTGMDWKTITRNSYWSDEPATYNTWVESSRPISGEHLMDYTICYKYAMAIGFNQNPITYGRGSAIFLHVKNPSDWSSSGCVSVEEPVMLQLLNLCHNGCYMIIVPDLESIAYY